MYFVNSGKCGGSYETDRGLITSPSYPKNYLGNDWCEYFISQPKGKVISLTILTMNIAQRGFPSSPCRDNLEIFDGSSSESPTMGKLCGNDSLIQAQSTQNQVFLR